jgi:hypothetical protein
MNRDVLVVTIFLVLVSLSISGLLVEHWMQAEAIAVKLAPLIRVDEDVLRTHLETMLAAGAVRRAVVYAIPWVVIAILLAVRRIRRLPGG